MKKFYYTLAALLITGAVVYGYSRIRSSANEDREKLSAFLKNHPFSQRPRFVAGEKPKGGRRAAPDRAWEQDYLRTMDPALGRPTPEALVPIMESMQMQAGMGIAPGAPQTPWEERGPNNVGGRTRGLVWDPNDGTGKRVWAGGVNGGLWYNNDITNANSSWVGVDDFWDNIAITCIAFDPANTQIMYVGTGEGYTANGSSSARGAGIWKSTNGGTSWSHVSSTSDFYWVLDIVVRNEGGTGVVYAAVDGRFHAGDWHGLDVAGIQRSANGGSSWTNVSPDVPSESIKLVASDLEIGPNNRIWAGSKANSYSASDKGGGRVFYSGNGTSWTISSTTTVNNSGGRVVIACAPSDSNVVYAAVESDGELETIIRTTNHGSSWTTRSEPEDVDQGIPDTDFSRGQAWYDLAIEVDPNNPDVVITGAIDLFRSTDGASNWTHISKWSDNNDLSALNCSYVHADQHTILYKPGSSSTVIFGNDGGVFYTSSIANAANNDVIQQRNKDYNITQYYACAIHPTAGSNVFIAGAQDNGTQRYGSAGVNATNEITGGDGGFCFIDQTDPDVAVASYIYNNFYLFADAGLSYIGEIMADNSTGKFINPADYDDNNHVLYSTKDAGSIWRVRNVNGSPAAPESLTISGMNDEVSHLRASPYSTTLFIGNDVGEIYKITNANGSHSSTDITGNNLPAGTVSCIEIGADDDELLVTYFNFGVVSVWYTDDGGNNWVNKEGNLPNMPVRWALFNPNNRNEVILATDLGVWSTDNLNSGSPTWVSSSSGLANTRVDMLQLRASDDMVIAATHGRGLFSSDAFSAQAPEADFSVSSQTVCLPQQISFYDSSIHDPISWLWAFVPNTVQYKNGTSATSQNPVVGFTAAGSYSVTLTSTNPLGSGVKTRTAFITVTPDLVPTINIQVPNNPICAGTTANFTAGITNGGSSPVYQWRVNSQPVGTNSSNFNTNTLQDGDSVTCEVTSNDPCAFPVPKRSTPIVMEIWNNPVVSLVLDDDEICTNEASLVLSGGLPAGGSFSGTAVSGGSFDPDGLTQGNHLVVYSFTDGNGCASAGTDNMQVWTAPNKPAISQAGDVLTCSETGASYEWTFNGGPISGAFAKTHTITASGSYTVKVTNAQGCSETSDLVDAFKVGVEEISGLSALRVYPNPTKGPVTISYELSDNRSMTYTLFDASGKQVFAKTSPASGKVNEELKLNLPAGTYVLRISDGVSELKRSVVIGN